MGADAPAPPLDALVAAPGLSERGRELDEIDARLALAASDRAAWS
ncbi:hypothetical protein [Phytohabitans kaempferiae]|uniref:Uncharacterized protein n=1 Tax=Phytohabitans kaempferiae TaxID=1620943 RepID=A0ABV6MEW5_9ACTN